MGGTDDVAQSNKAYTFKTYVNYIMNNHNTSPEILFLLFLFLPKTFIPCEMEKHPWEEGTSRIVLPLLLFCDRSTQPQRLLLVQQV